MINILKRCRNIFSLLFCGNKLKNRGKNNIISYDTSKIPFNVGKKLSFFIFSIFEDSIFMLQFENLRKDI